MPFSNSTIRRPDVVEAVDAGDAVADGQHLSDFGNFSLLAEILDLSLRIAEISAAGCPSACLFHRVRSN